MYVNVKTPASCGELLQGFIDGNEFLINAPIPLFSEARAFISTPHTKDSLREKGFSKAAFAIEKMIEIHAKNTNFEYNVHINSAIPRNKGLSSSTAEISGAVLAASKILNLNLSYQDISQFLIDVDGSSDAVFLKGITHIQQLNGQVCSQYENIPNLSFIIVDAGGEIETQKFDRKFARWVSIEHEFSIKRALDLMKQGFETGNSAHVAKAATISAKVNQFIHHKSPFQTLLEGTRQHGGLGVNCAHTGTILGVMFDHTKTDANTLTERVKELINPLPILGVYPLIGGLSEIEMSEAFIARQAQIFSDANALNFGTA